MKKKETYQLNDKKTYQFRQPPLALRAPPSAFSTLPSSSGCSHRRARRGWCGLGRDHRCWKCLLFFSFASSCNIFLLKKTFFWILFRISGTNRPCWKMIIILVQKINIRLVFREKNDKKKEEVTNNRCDWRRNWWAGTVRGFWKLLSRVCTKFRFHWSTWQTDLNVSALAYKMTSFKSKSFV